MAGLAAIEHELRKNDFVGDFTELHRKWLWMSSAATEQFRKEDADWPVYVGIHETNDGYDLHFGCISDRFHDEESAKVVRSALSKDIPGLNGRRQRVQLKTGLNREDVIKEADNYLKMIDNATRTA
jgi:hypothetical protein